MIPPCKWTFVAVLASSNQVAWVRRGTLRAAGSRYSQPHALANGAGLPRVARAWRGRSGLRCDRLTKVALIIEPGYGCLGNGEAGEWRLRFGVNGHATRKPGEVEGWLMASDEQKQLAIAFLENFNQADPEVFERLITDDFRFEIVSSLKEF